MKFTELALSESFIKDLDEINFTDCTHVQELVIPHLINKKNVMVQAQTGTGKTAAFLIPMMENFIQHSRQKDAQSSRFPKGLIISPTRELATQIMEDAQILGAESHNIKGALLFGGGNFEVQKKALKLAQFIVATPGRLIDICGSQPKLLSEIEYFVLDEADRLFDMGFYPDLTKIINMLPSREDRISMLFSATLPPKVRNLAQHDFSNPVVIDVPSENLAVDKIKQEIIHLLHAEKLPVLLGLLRTLKEGETAMVFVNTKRVTEEIAHRLIYNGLSCDYIIGDLPQPRRQRVINKLKEGKTAVLICTDVAARGLHIHDLHLVINFDLPDDPQSYIHRIGRTGRAGKHGRAITLACDRHVYNLESIEKLLTHSIPTMEEDYHNLKIEDASKGVPPRELVKTSYKALGTPKLMRGLRSAMDAPPRSNSRSSPRSSRRPSTRSSSHTSSERKEHRADKKDTRNEFTRPNTQNKKYQGTSSSRARPSSKKSTFNDKNLLLDKKPIRTQESQSTANNPPSKSDSFVSIIKNIFSKKNATSSHTEKSNIPHNNSQVSTDDVDSYSRVPRNKDQQSSNRYSNRSNNRNSTSNRHGSRSRSTASRSGESKHNFKRSNTRNTNRSPQRNHGR